MRTTPFHSAVESLRPSTGAARAPCSRPVPAGRSTPETPARPADLLVTGDGVIACRLWFDCTPEHEFAGIRPTGRRASFAEHVFYRFRESRIEQVWSLVDLDALREQMAPDTAPHNP